MSATTEFSSKPPASDGADSTDVGHGLGIAFERVAQTFPTSLAVSSDTWTASYRDFNATTNRLAHKLIALGGAVGDRVAILMEHDTPAIAANLAITKAGRIVVVLYPGDPIARLRALTSDAEPSVVVADRENRELADELAGNRSSVVTFDPRASAGNSENPTIAVDPGATAALIYTSGATGRPKGVMRTHRQIHRNAAVHTQAMRFTSADRIPLFSTIGTGQGSSALWFTLLNGATLCPFPLKRRGTAGLAEWMADSRLTFYGSSASVFRTLVKTIGEQTTFPCVRAVRLSSEPATADDFRSYLRHFPSADMFVHMLSSTETGKIAWSTWARDSKIPEGTLPVGLVPDDIEVQIVNDDGEPVPPGAVGEIVVRSRYAAAGYWRDPALTARRFLPDPDDPDVRRVRTGDMARFNEAGFLEFQGRKDDRIKIRGNRIELADVEAALAKLAGVERAAVVAVPRDGHEPLLVAYVVLRDGASWPEARLRHAVAANLPLHMLPSRFEFVDALPFSAGGKVDRDALRRRPLTRRDDQIVVAPQTETETLLADIWAELLEVPQAGRDNDFFRLGGDSLTGAIVAAHVGSAFEVDISLSDVAAHPTIAQLAALIDDRRQAPHGVMGVPEIAKVERAGPLPLSIFQERLWKIAQVRPLERGMRFYRIAGKLDVGVLEDCLRYLVDRHEVLRTTFDVADGRPRQFIHPAGALYFSLIDLSTSHQAEARAESHAAEELNKPIDPGRLPTVRHLLFRMRDDEHWLLLIAHPLTLDGWSTAILLDELAVLYEAKLKGMPPPIPTEMPLQYADYAVWHRRHMRVDGPAYGEMLDWWKRVFAKRMRPVRLPFRRSKPLVGVDYRLGVIHWQLDAGAAQRLDRLARCAGVTHYAIRLALFVALVADISRRSTVVLGTTFSNRSRIATRNLVGPLATVAPLMFSYNARLPVRTWIATVRDRLYETETHAGIPYEELYEAMRAAGLKPTPVRVTFLLSADLAEQQFGGLTLKRIAYPIGEMPWGCQVYIDERNPENCRVDFDAGLYDRKGMQAMVDRYVRLLEIAARRPELTIGRLMALSSENPLRRAVAGYATRFADPVGAR